ncbi:MAG: threonine synthase, partial [Clostridia bacterium]|nr:threonine synthase [Clostridia bacterium]
MYVSTRGGERLTASKAILKGLASDGGLFIPTKIDKLNIDANYVLKSYNEIAFDVLKIFLDDFSDKEI